jgi:hypothetical protein
MVTAFALQLGAPFWFDMLKKVITIRSAGRSPEEAHTSPKEVQLALQRGQTREKRTKQNR